MVAFSEVVAKMLILGKLNWFMTGSIQVEKCSLKGTQNKLTLKSH